MAFFEKRGELVPVYVFIFPAKCNFRAHAVAVTGIERGKEKKRNKTLMQETSHGRHSIKIGEAKFKLTTLRAEKKLKGAQTMKCKL